VSRWLTAGEAQFLPGEGNKLPHQFLQRVHGDR
jgi:hypothetical protein